MAYTTIDLNADLGETEGDYLELLSIITSANVACGGHAGGGQLLKDTVKAAAEKGVQVGAHPSYPDKTNFGRLSMRGQIPQLTEVIAKQIKQVADELDLHGLKLSHVKAHGALYNDAMIYPDIAQVIIDAVTMVASGTKILGLPKSVLEKLCLEQGIGFTAEGFLDRAYLDDGTLVPRSRVGAVLNHAEALEQIKQLIESGTVTTADGTKLKLDIVTLCVHADTPSAAKTAADVKNMLISSGVSVQAF